MNCLQLLSKVGHGPSTLRDTWAVSKRMIFMHSSILNFPHLLNNSHSNLQSHSLKYGRRDFSLRNISCILESAHPTHVKRWYASSSPISNYEKGYWFEALVANVFSFINMQQTGKSHDMGVDFVGHWNQFQDCVLLGQCKNETKKCSSRVVREMQGVISRYEHEKLEPIGIIVSSLGFSPQALLHHKQAQVPLILVKIDLNGNLRQWDMNIRASRILEKLVVVRDSTGRGNAAESRISLYYSHPNGNLIPILG